MPKIDAQIAAAEAKLQQLKARQKRDVARARSIATKNERSQELRRKILVGAIVLAKVEAGEIPRAEFRHWLDQAIERSDDRELFELPVKDTEHA